MTKNRGPVNLITFQPQGPMGTSHHFGYEAINSAYQTWQLVRRHVTDNILYKIFQRLISLQAQDSHTPHRGYYFSLKHLYMFIPSLCFQYICSFHCSVLNLKHLHMLISLLLFSTSNTCMCSFHYSLFSHEACICLFLYSNFSHEHTYIFIPLLCCQPPTTTTATTATTLTVFFYWKQQIHTNSISQVSTSKTKYSRLSLFRTCLFRITTYLEVKIWSLF